MKIIEVIADIGHLDTIKSIAEHQHIDDVWYGHENEDGRVSARLLVSPSKRQAVLDALQNVLKSSENMHIMIIPVEATLPKPSVDEDDDKDAEKKKPATRTREEIFALVEKDANLDINYILLVFLSSIVAAIGLLENNVAVIIGAMVIAPLLGPNIAFALGTSLGERQLVWKSFLAIIFGVILAIFTACIIGFIWPGTFDSAELMLRADVGYSGTAIALASGAAASLSLVTGLSSVLVGVMVAVALMPPAVTIGLMISSQQYDHVLGAALLLGVNIVCINLSAKLVFLYRGIQPRTWLEARKSKESRTLYLIMWLVLLVLLFVAIYFRHKTV